MVHGGEPNGNQQGAIWWDPMTLPSFSLIFIVSKSLNTFGFCFCGIIYNFCSKILAIPYLPVHSTSSLTVAGNIRCQQHTIQMKLSYHFFYQVCHSLLSVHINSLAYRTFIYFEINLHCYFTLTSYYNINRSGQTF